MADDTVMEEREELMVSPRSGEPHFRIAHFLKPSAATTAAAAAPSAAATFNASPPKLKFSAWVCRSPKWRAWVEQMRSSHHSTWKKAGILDAIATTTYPIPRCEALILALSEKWSPSTNSFVFPWGEASITLEDMISLGAFSVLGDPVFTPPADAEAALKVKKLLESRFELYKNAGKKACRSRWMTKFMGSGSEIEHEAFLAYWLSRFVFSFSCNSIRKSVIPIAVRLARGIRIALAPPVLASIYRAFTLLNNAVSEIAVSAPLALVQVWAWERLPLLRPNPRQVGENELRISRWVGTHRDIRSSTSLDSNLNFRWRPYCKEVVGNESFGRCVRVCRLIGVEKGCVEQYLPHRVSMQFGMDQDLPGHVSAPDEQVLDCEIAWGDYIKPVGDVEAVCVARGTYEPCVTSRYLEWWKKQVVSEQLNVDDLPLRAWLSHCTAKIAKSAFKRTKRHCTAKIAKSAFKRTKRHCNAKIAKSAFKRTKRQYLQLFRRQRNPGFASMPQTHSAANANASESYVKSLEGFAKSHESSEKLMSALMEVCGSGVGCEIEGNVEFQGEICLFSAIRNEESSEKLMPAPLEVCESGVGCVIEGNLEFQGEICVFSDVRNEESSEKLMPAPMEACRESEGNVEFQGEICLFSAVRNEESLEKLMPAPLEACEPGSGVQIEGNVEFQGEICLFSSVRNEESSEMLMPPATTEASELGVGFEIEVKQRENCLIQAVMNGDSSENLAPAPMEASESGGGCEIEGKQGEKFLFQATCNEESSEKLMLAPMEVCGRDIEGSFTIRGEKCSVSPKSNEESSKPAQMEAFGSVEGKLGENENVVQLSEAKNDLEKVEERLRIVEEILRQIREGRLLCHIVSQKKKKRS